MFTSYFKLGQDRRERKVISVVYSAYYLQYLLMTILQTVFETIWLVGPPGETLE